MATGAAALTGCGAADGLGAALGDTGPAENLRSAVGFFTGTARDNGANMTTGDMYAGPRDDKPAKRWVQLTRGSAGGLSPIVQDAAGRTLYRFDEDDNNPPKSNCNGDCAKTWRPVLVEPSSRVFVKDVPAEEVGVLKRADDTLQLTLNGWGLYTFKGDEKPGDINGQGVNRTWFAVSPTGGKVVSDNDGGETGQESSAPESAVRLGDGSAILDSGKDFSEPNGSFGVAGPGCVEVPQPDLVRSIQLSGGPVKLWKGPNCTGESTVITDSVADLDMIGFDEQVVSIRFGDE
ncbi:COG4315 family predicted lipoprotein [Saccharopolyspora sp. 5N708]|uniref:COG4315 family predicted lipoprotein n=1 Tax=Saccharopolyspora sp. 5N708 TaxID=3457424 RepID=UPI003FCFFE40